MQQAQYYYDLTGSDEEEAVARRGEQGDRAEEPRLLQQISLEVRSSHLGDSGLSALLERLEPHQ